MRAKIAAVATEHRPRDGLNHRALRGADPVRAQEVGTAGSVLPGPPGTVVEEGRELRVHLVQVARGVLVQNDDIGAQPFQTPVLLRVKDLTHQSHVPVTEHPHEQNGQVPGNTVRPETGLTELVGGNRVRSGPQGAVREEHSRRQALEEQRFVVRNTQVPQTALRVGEGERECAGRRARIAVLPGERFSGRAIRGDARGEGEAHGGPRVEPDALAEAEDGIEDEARWCPTTRARRARRGCWYPDRGR